MIHKLRPELPPLPERLKKLPVDERGYPVPWFVEYIDGKPDFRVMSAKSFRDAIKWRRCWTCGDHLGIKLAFVVGPMCAVSRTSGEPPSHLECARFAVIACPFLTRPHMVRRDTSDIEKKAGVKPEMAGIGLKRNPGVSIIWVTKSYEHWRPAGGGILMTMGEPLFVESYAEGRRATTEELRASFDSGYPSLLELATLEGPDAVRELEAQALAARGLLGIAA
jgi:hypothetical protein